MSYNPDNLQLLIDAITEQTKAINRLANSNAMLADAIAQERDEEEETPTTYMDGTPT